MRKLRRVYNSEHRDGRERRLEADLRNAALDLQAELEQQSGPVVTWLTQHHPIITLIRTLRPKCYVGDCVHLINVVSAEEAIPVLSHPSPQSVGTQGDRPTGHTLQTLVVLQEGGPHLCGESWRCLQQLPRAGRLETRDIF